MVPRLKQIISRVKAVPSQIDVIITESLEENKEIAADLITNQLTHGIRGDGEEMTEYRSDEYAIFKRSIGSISSPLTDLKLTGDYHRSIELQTKGTEALIVSRDSKDEKLTLKYGEETKQYTEESKKDLRQFIKPDIQIGLNKFILKQ